MNGLEPILVPLVTHSGNPTAGRAPGAGFKSGQ